MDDVESVVSSGEGADASLLSAPIGDFELVSNFDIGHETLADEPIEEMPRNFTGSTGPTLGPASWNQTICFGFSEFRATDPMMQLPWEQGVMNEIFGTSAIHQSLQAKPLAEPLPASADKPATSDPVQGHVAHMEDACYRKAVKNLKDLEYFEGKRQQTDLACGQWLELLGCNWSASDVGEMISRELQRDPTGDSAVETLKASFGLKSPATLQKRAAAFRRYLKWHTNHHLRSEFEVIPLPLDEFDVWQYFHYLQAERRQMARGFTTPCSFLEAVRFAKFALGLRGTEQILGSKRLLGFAALEKREKGPTKQAPPLELAHVKRLHEILDSDSCLTDRLGAGVMLVCFYARARWSDLRFVHHIEYEDRRGGFLTLYTREHKTSSVGARREQYLPLVAPTEGVTAGNWAAIFLDVYEQSGLDIHKVPLGPLLPAPRDGGTFFARPLTTSEAATWLRLLLSDIPDAEHVRSHSLKCTLLVWAAKAGVEKEVRCVLGHHASALEGSEVVYSRHLQTRALRKLQMLLHRIRIGLGVEVMLTDQTLWPHPEDGIPELGFRSLPCPWRLLEARQLLRLLFWIKSFLARAPWIWRFRRHRKAFRHLLRATR